MKMVSTSGALTRGKKVVLFFNVMVTRSHVLTRMRKLSRSSLLMANMKFSRLAPQIAIENRILFFTIKANSLFLKLIVSGYSTAQEYISLTLERKDLVTGN